MLKRSRGMALFKKTLDQIREEQKRRMVVNGSGDDKKNARKGNPTGQIPSGAPPIKRSTGTLTRLEVFCPDCEKMTAHRILRYEGDYGMVKCNEITCGCEHRIPFKVRRNK